ncbi:hypothetical protein LPJ66_010713 [Kickxella alabastrina]|uniref:Uncharacterized protein n=1 Tax=Kickxella alabastrina TaxID=61397 RepID=A0ACC1HZR5_9FUNG|nr:hypothetical protein LPJ66_010713 [Kickxella alabastrina]
MDNSNNSDTNTEAVEATHGFFQFADYSDSDSDSDGGLFGKTRDRRVAFDSSQINYQPKIDQDNWFDKTPTQITQWISAHGGLDEVTFTAQRLYFTKQYARAADLCQQATLAFVGRFERNLRVATIRELLEIGGLAAVRERDCQRVGFFLEWYERCGGMNPGYNRFLMELLGCLGRWEDVLTQCVLYLEQRKQDAKIWETIGRALTNVSKDKSAENRNAGKQQQQQQQLVHLALGSFYKSHLVMRECKSWKTTDEALRQRRIQEDELREGAVQALRVLGREAECAAASGDRDEREGEGGLDGGVLWGMCREMGAQAELALSGGCSGPLDRSLEWILAHMKPSAGAGADADVGAGADADGSDEDNNVEEL